MKKTEIIAKYGEETYQRILEQQKQRYQDNKEEELEQQRQYQQTPKGRAVHLCALYRREDKKQNRGECTLTPDYIIDHIFPNGCLYCGEKDYNKLGCDRVDNDLPHTPDNVVCCCADCNRKRQKKGFDKFLNMSWRKRFS